jgi:hypothetical protein
VLNVNIFAIELSTGGADLRKPGRDGKITFEGRSPKYNSSSVPCPQLSDCSDQVWAVEAQSLMWENKTYPLHADFVDRRPSSSRVEWHNFFSTQHLVPYHEIQLQKARQPKHLSYNHVSHDVGQYVDIVCGAILTKRLGGGKEIMKI